MTTHRGVPISLCATCHRILTHQTTLDFGEPA